MRGVKSTIALIVVLIGLVAYIYFVDSKKPASGAPETKAKAFTVDADQIEEIQIKPTSGDASRFRSMTTRTPSRFDSSRTSLIPSMRLSLAASAIFSTSPFLPT